ncbi:hypothetical protein SPRG_03374, partial [Saprolegnia parasitica CBS 223.65]
DVNCTISSRLSLLCTDREGRAEDERARAPESPCLIPDGMSRTSDCESSILNPKISASAQTCAIERRACEGPPQNDSCGPLCRGPRPARVGHGHRCVVDAAQKC